MFSYPAEINHVDVLNTKYQVFSCMVGSNGQGKSNAIPATASHRRNRGFYIVRVYSRPRGQSLISVEIPTILVLLCTPPPPLITTENDHPGCRTSPPPHFARPLQQPRAIQAGPFINLTKEYRRRPVVVESTSICLLLNLYVYMYLAKHSYLYDVCYV